MDSNRKRKREDGSPSCVVNIFVITPICKTFESMRFPSIKRYRISGAGTFYGDETFKTGLHILDEYVG